MNSKYTWYQYPHPKAVNNCEALKHYNAAERLEIYNDYIENRKILYTGLEFDDYWINKLKAIDEDGFVIIKDFFNKELLQNLKNETESLLDKGQHLWQNQTQPQQEIRKTHNFTAINQPLLNVKSLLPIVFHEHLITLASHYYGCLPSVGGVNLRKSFVTDLPEQTTEIFHADPNSLRFIKMFLYLNDVDENGGPLCMVKGSFKNKFEGWNNSDEEGKDPHWQYKRWTQEQIEEFYGKENIKYITANVGDLIIGNTIAFHRGTKCKKQDRLMLTMHVSPHPEFFQDPVFKMYQKDYNNLNDLQKGYSDYLIKV
jgi:hypothetical protein